MKSSIKKMEQMGCLSAFENEQQDSPYYDPIFDSMDQLEIQTGREPEGGRGHLKPVGLKKQMTREEQKGYTTHGQWLVTAETEWN